MSADQLRNRTVGCKMSDSEYEKLAAVAEQDGMTLGEWVREVLLERMEGRKPSVIEETVLAETLALRTILLNAFYKLAQGEKLTGDEMQAIIDRADTGKAAKASERLGAAPEMNACRVYACSCLSKNSLIATARNIFFRPI